MTYCQMYGHKWVRYGDGTGTTVGSYFLGPPRCSVCGVTQAEEKPKPKETS